MTRLAYGGGGDMGARLALSRFAVMTSHASGDGHGMVKTYPGFIGAGGAMADLAVVAISDIGRAVQRVLGFAPRADIVVAPDTAGRNVEMVESGDRNPSRGAVAGRAGGDCSNVFRGLSGRDDAIVAGGAGSQIGAFMVEFCRRPSSGDMTGIARGSRSNMAGRFTGGAFAVMAGGASAGRDAGVREDCGRPSAGMVACIAGFSSGDVSRWLGSTPHFITGDMAILTLGRGAFENALHMARLAFGSRVRPRKLKAGFKMAEVGARFGFCSPTRGHPERGAERGQKGKCPCKLPCKRYIAPLPLEHKTP